MVATLKIDLSQQIIFIKFNQMETGTGSVKKCVVEQNIYQWIIQNFWAFQQYNTIEWNYFKYLI